MIHLNHNHLNFRNGWLLCLKYKINVIIEPVILLFCKCIFQTIRLGK